MPSDGFRRDNQGTVATPGRMEDFELKSLLLDADRAARRIEDALDASRDATQCTLLAVGHYVQFMLLTA